MSTWPILSLLVFLPVAGIAFLALTGRGGAENDRNARDVTLWTSLANLALAIVLAVRFDPGKDGFQFVEHAAWLPELGVAYHVGVDGISVLFILLTTLLVPICIVASWTTVVERVRSWMVAFLAMEALMIGVFVARDALLFYVFFEAILIPMFLIIGIWGGERRVHAAFKFVLYTLAGSVLFLIAILTLASLAGSTDMDLLEHTPIAIDAQRWIWIAMFASFAVKVPMWPLHTWLPDAHVQAPTAGSVILAGVLLKLGGYGFIRFSLPMLPAASAEFMPLVYVLSAVAILYTSLVALMQRDMKRLIAYSSVAHMGVVTLGLFTASARAISGAIVQMLSHGLVSAALFLVVGVVYDRRHSREIADYGGLVHSMPRYAVLFMLFALAAVGLPATSGFVGEFLVIVGVFPVSAVFAACAAAGMVLSAAYMLWLYRRVVFGGVPAGPPLPDLDRRETGMFLPLAILVLLLGIQPDFVFQLIEGPSAELAARLLAAQAGGGA
ncbi:MAG: NADH-quinone oxidoreductase subunit M [Rhodospirillales bacterium]|nr:NADH-quinone oxidoreductase subunit M [Rhodospirillales bacterium]MXX21717.1 NADH-quinone oxidoreductase subunit M [Rhodospirillales bacterium]MYE18638.1 NADH-quinone oxidoreductase subunit M [Rhodospirillales bacterium]